jgi:hypothetical protein
MSEVGKESPTALDPKRDASAFGKIDLTKYLTLSNAKTLLS